MLIKLQNGTWQDMSNVVGLRVALCKGMSRCYYTILKSLIIGTMAQAALGVRGKYGEEMAMQELMSMMTEAAKLVHYNKE